MSVRQGRNASSRSLSVPPGEFAPRHSAVALRAALLICVPLAVWWHDSGTQAQAQSITRDTVPQPRHAANTASATAVHTLNLPAAPLADALSRLASETGSHLSVDGALTAGKQAPALRGNMTLRQALDTLLRGTGLEARESGGRYFIQPEPKRRSNVANLETVTVLGRGDPKDEVFETSHSINVVTRDDIERFRGTSVGDIFQGIPGVLVAENRNSGGLDVNIRGMQGQGRVPVLVDGTRQETTVYRGYAGVASRSYVDPDLIGNIQINKGPTMSAQGTGAVGGLVDMRTINAEDVVAPGEDFGMRVRGSLIGNTGRLQPGTPAGYEQGGRYRSNCAYDCSADAMPASFAPDSGMNRPGLMRFRDGAGSVAVAKRLEHVDLLAALVWRRQGNYYAGKRGGNPGHMVYGTPVNTPFYTETRVSRGGDSPFRAGELIPNTQFENQSVLLKSRFYLPADQELDLSWLRYSSDFGETMPSQIIRFGQPMQWLDSHVVNNTYAVRYRINPPDSDWLDLSANLWHTDKSSQINTPGVTGIDSVSTRFEDNTRDDEDYKRWGLDVSNRSRVHALGEMVFDYGLALQHERLDATSNGNSAFYGADRAGKRWEASLFANMDWHFAPRWTLTLGARQTWFGSEDDRAITQECIYEFDGVAGQYVCGDPTRYKKNDQGLAPLASLTWELLDGLQLYARYAEGLRMPSLFETTGGVSVSPAAAVGLRPEHAKNKEVGINFLGEGIGPGKGKLGIKLAYFRNDIKDYLTRTSPNAWEVTSNPFFVMRNIDSAAFHGFEINASYDTGAFFASLGATKYNKIEICHEGSYRRHVCNNYGIANSYINNMVPPNWHASFTLGTRLFNERLTMGMRATLIGERNSEPRFNNDASRGFNQVVQWNAYRTYDLFLTYKFNDKFSVDFNIDNLTDRYYLDALSLGVVPAPGRTARLGVTMQF